MALRSGYYGLKRKLFEKVLGLPAIKSIGDGLSLNSTTGELSASGGGGGTTVVANPEGTATADLTKLKVDDTIYGVDGDTSDCYKITDDTESTIVDGDFIPFLDSSAASGDGAPKKSTWSNLKNKILTGVAMISAIATNEPESTASRSYLVGQHFYKNGKFCTVMANITAGDTLTLNANYTQGMLADYTQTIDITSLFTIDSNIEIVSDSTKFYKLGNMVFFHIRGTFKSSYTGGEIVTGGVNARTTDFFPLYGTDWGTPSIIAMADINATTQKMQLAGTPSVVGKSFVTQGVYIENVH